MGPDARVLVDKARKLVQEYKRIYMEEPPVATLVKEVAAVMQEYTQSGYVLLFFLCEVAIGERATWKCGSILNSFFSHYHYNGKTEE
jgi:20S proteasome subunit alpha 2